MTPEEHYRKTDEIIAKFKNGKELYLKSAEFNKIVQMLVRGSTPYECIEQMVNVVDNINDAFLQQILRNHPNPTIK